MMNYSVCLSLSFFVIFFLGGGRAQIFLRSGVNGKQGKSISILGSLKFEANCVLVILITPVQSS